MTRIPSWNFIFSRRWFQELSHLTQQRLQEMESWPFFRDAGSCLVMLDHASCYDYLLPLNQQRKWLTMNMLNNFQHLKYTFIKISGMHGRVLVQTFPNYATVSKDGSLSSKFWEGLQSSKPLGFCLVNLVTSCRSVFLSESVCFAFRRKSFQDKKKPSAERRRPSLVFHVFWWFVSSLLQVGMLYKYYIIGRYIYVQVQRVETLSRTPSVKVKTYWSVRIVWLSLSSVWTIVDL